MTNAADEIRRVLADVLRFLHGRPDGASGWDILEACAGHEADWVWLALGWARSAGRVTVSGPPGDIRVCTFALVLNASTGMGFLCPVCGGEVPVHSWEIGPGTEVICPRCRSVHEVRSPGEPIRCIAAARPIAWAPPY
jgi:hypothetical protein